MDPLPDIDLLIKLQQSRDIVIGEGTRTDKIVTLSKAFGGEDGPKVPKSIKLDEATRAKCVWFISFEGNKSYGPLSINEIERFAHDKVINGYGFCMAGRDGEVARNW